MRKQRAKSSWRSKERWKSSPNEASNRQHPRWRTPLKLVTQLARLCAGHAPLVTSLILLPSDFADESVPSALFAATGNKQSLHTRGSIFASRHCLLAEKPLNQFVAADFKMRSHVVKNSGQRSHFERVVIRNRDMMLVVLAGGQTQMTARLPG